MIDFRFTAGLSSFVAVLAFGIPRQALADDPAPPNEVWVDFLWAAIDRDGSEDTPFNTLDEAVGNVAVAGTVNVEAGASSETPRITKALRLEAAGGAARIGVPNAPQIVAPGIAASPQPQIGGLGDDALFSVEAAGTAPLAYQWRVGGVDLADGGAISGAQSDTLSVTGAALENAGEYSCVVANCAGSAESDAAELAFDYIPVGPGDSIQLALDAAAEGGVIEVSPGTYAENLVFYGRDIVLRSTDPEDEDIIAATILEGEGAGSVIVFSGAESAQCVIEGFTIRYGAGTPAGGAVYGGGVYGNGALATIRNNTLMVNSAFGAGVSGYGGAIAGCDGLIENNIFTENYADYGGALYGCGGSLMDNIFRLNQSVESGGALYQCSGAARNCVFSFNRSYNTGGAIASCAGVIQNDTVWGNRAEVGGGFYGCQSATIQNCIVWANEAPIYPQIDGGGSAMPDYCCIQEWTGGGTGNISPGQGPQLRLPEAGFFRLSPGSPCINAGMTVAGLSADMELDPRGGDAFDIGADEYVAEPTPLPAPQNFLADTWDRLYDPPYNYDDVVHLEWDAVPGDVDSYGIFLATRPGGPYYYVARTANTSADFMLDPGPLYYWRVGAFRIVPPGPPLVWDPNRIRAHLKDLWTFISERLGYCSANMDASPMRTVILDPGHGGEDGGSERYYGAWTFYTGPGETVLESMLSHGLVWGWGSPFDPPEDKIHKGIIDFLQAKMDADAAQNNGKYRLQYRVTRPRSYDTVWKPENGRTPLEYRALYARNWKALCFLSLHFNSGSSTNKNMIALLYPVDNESALPYTETVDETPLKYLVSDGARQYFKDYVVSTPNSWGMMDQWNLPADDSFAQRIINETHEAMVASLSDSTTQIWKTAAQHGGLDKGHWRHLRDRLLWRRMDREDGEVDAEIEYFDDQWTWEFIRPRLEGYGFTESTIFPDGIGRDMPALILEVLFMDNTPYFEKWCALSENPGGQAVLIEGVASAIANALWDYAGTLE